MKRHRHNKKNKTGVLKASVCTLVLLSVGGTAYAFKLDVGNPDFSVRWDNTVRYNLGVRAEDRDDNISRNPTYDESDRKFGKGDIVTNRLDVLSEMDVVYKERFGGRVSAAGWYDDAYHNSNTNPDPAAAVSVGCNYASCEHNSQAKRFHKGPSGEILDAFLFAGFDIGDSILNLKAGQHTVYWGEGLLFGNHAISYSQAPLDGRKAVSSPGIETKEVFLPISQLSAQLQLNSQWSFAAQYYLDWKATRVPNGGTYLANNDILDADQIPVSLGALGRTALYHDSKGELDADGAFGLNTRWSIPNSDVVLGLYYRQYNDYNPWSVQTIAPTVAFGPGGIAVTPGAYRFVYAEDVKLYGFSAATVFNGVSVGFELSYREDAPLNSTAINAIDREGARGNTYHMILNAVSGLPYSPLWDTGTVAAELAYNRLDKVTSHKELFNSVDYACAATGGRDTGCSTEDFTAIAVNFTPQYLQVLPALDIDLPMTVNYSIHGNSPNAAAGNQDELNWSVGVRGNYRNTHELTLRYQDRYANQGPVNPALGYINSGNGSNYSLNDRAYYSLTYKTSF